MGRYANVYRYAKVGRYAKVDWCGFLPSGRCAKVESGMQMYT